MRGKQNARPRHSGNSLKALPREDSVRPYGRNKGYFRSKREIIARMGKSQTEKA